jgi:hypothetical protein
VSDDLGTGATGPAATGPAAPGGEPVGSVGEEAVKLLGALSDWSKSQGAGSADSAMGAVGAMSEVFSQVNEHIATGGADCKYCPVCQLISAVRATSPEVKSHLAVAASSLMHAAAGVLSTQVPQDTNNSPVEKIDLDDEGSWDDS